MDMYAKATLFSFRNVNVFLFALVPTQIPVRMYRDVLCVIGSIYVYSQLCRPSRNASESALTAASWKRRLTSFQHTDILSAG